MSADADFQARQDVVPVVASDHIKKYVVAVVPLDDETDHPARGGGSGVAIQVGHRRFIASACHVLVVPNERLTLLGPGQSAREWVAPGGILRRGVRADPTVDIAFLEVDDVLAGRLGCAFVPLARLRPRSGRLPVGPPVMLHGFPGALRDTDGLDVRAGARGLATVGIGTPPQHAARPDLHVYFDYPKTWMRLGAEAPATSAEGYSGSGIWLLNYLPDKLWGPEHCELIAIQTDWQETQRWIRGTEVQHWLQLVADSYEDLRPLVEDHLRDTTAR